MLGVLQLGVAQLARGKVAEVSCHLLHSGTCSMMGTVAAASTKEITNDLPMLTLMGQRCGILNETF